MKKKISNLEQTHIDMIYSIRNGKWEIYNFHYNFIVKKFNTKLLFTDADSLCYNFMKKIHTKKYVQKMYKYKKLFDQSNFPVSSKYYCSNREE